MLMMQHHPYGQKCIPTLLLSFTTTIPTVPTSTLLCFYDEVFFILLVTAPAVLLAAGPVAAVIAASLLWTKKAAGPAPAAAGNALAGHSPGFAKSWMPVPPMASLDLRFSKPLADPIPKPSQN